MWNNIYDHEDWVFMGNLYVWRGLPLEPGGDGGEFDHGIVVGLCISETAVLWDFFTHNSLWGFSQKGMKNKKHPVSFASVGENSLLMRGQRRKARLFRATVTQIIHSL